jgi:PAS domain S-box-containing protein
LNYTARTPAFVTAGQISRNFGMWQDRAFAGPVVVTHHGRPRVVMLSADHYTLGEEAAGAPSEAQLSALLNHIGEGFLALDREMRIVAVNPVFEAYVGKAANQVVGASWPALFPELAGSVMAEQYHRVLRTGEATEFEVVSSVFPGRVISVRAFPYGDGMAVLFVNRTAEREREDRLSEGLALEAAASALPGLALATLNLRGGLAQVDDAFVALTGFDRAELMRCRLADILRPRDRMALNDAIDAALADAPPRAVFVRLLSRSGVEAPVHLSLAPIRRGDRPEGLRACVMSSPEV